MSPDIETLAMAAGIFASVFGIIDPLGNTIVFTAMTREFTPAERRHVIRKTVLMGSVVLLSFGLIGTLVLRLLEITLPAFQIAGGILTFVIGFSMLHAKPSGTKHSQHEMHDAQEKDSLGVTHLGLPLYAGPGAITTVMLLMSAKYPGGPGVEVALRAWVLATILIVMLISYFAMVHSESIYRYMGRSGLMAMTRILGLLITAIAVQFILDGVATVVTEWGVI